LKACSEIVESQKSLDKLRALGFPDWAIIWIERYAVTHFREKVNRNICCFPFFFVMLKS